jgi:hypothetical protein
MAITNISSSAYFTPAESSEILRPVTAVAGDIIHAHITWRKTGTPITMGAMSWNGQTLNKVGTTLNDGEAFTESHWIQASTGATADLTATLSAAEHYTITIKVERPPASTTISVGGLQEQIYTSGVYTDPSLIVNSVPSGALTVSTLKYMGWDEGYGTMSGTLSANAPFSTAVGTTNTNYRGVWALYVANDSSSTGAVVASWTRSNPAEGPQYAHRAFYFSTAPVPSIDTVSSPVSDGETGKVITTTNLGTLTSMSVGGVAVASVSATGGDGTWVVKSRTDGSTHSGYGTKTVLVGDGTATASSTTVVNPPSTQSYVTLTSAPTAAGYIGAYRTVNIGDQFAFDTATQLGVETNYIDVDGGIYTDYSGSQVMWHWATGTGIITQITLITGVIEDTTPNPFTFTDVTNASLSTQYTSNTITVTGIDTPTAISITGGTYSVNGGSYTSSPGTVTNGATVSVRVTSSASFATAVNAVLTIGGTSDTYTVTTLAADTTPDAFTFTDVTGATLSTIYTSNSITVSGINSNAAISITGGTYSINGGGYTSSPGTVANTDTVTVRATSSGSFSTTVNAVLTIGGVSDTYSVTTAAADTTPDAFSFTDVTGATLSTVYTSNTITVSGINSAANITVTGGTYSKNGGSYTNTAGTVSVGDTVSTRITSSASNSTAVNSVVTIGGVSDTYTVTTVGIVVPGNNKSKKLNIGIKIGI